MDKETVSEWKTDTPSLLPDFIIGGAMKSGTSTLHSILNTHPDIFIPDEEIHFFDIDSLFQHREFNFYHNDTDKWTYQMVQNNLQKLWQWYFSKFENNDSLLTGEDSTTYLASKIAAERIAVQEKNIKLIFLLRHPTERAYSQYLHFLRSGRAIYSFENMIKYQPEFLLTRGLYKEQLEKYYAQIPRKFIKVILFEDFIRDTRKIVEQVCNFLDVDFNKFEENAFELHANKTRLPKFIKLQILHNRIHRVFGKFTKPGALPDSPIHKKQGRSLWGSLLEKAHRFLNPLSREKKPAIKGSTRRFLDHFFYDKLQGIDELVGKEVLSTWFSKSEKNA